MLSLTIINSDNICSSFELDSTPGVQYRLGRSSSCEIALPDELHLSRVHCFLTIGDGCVLLTDNNSSNGIFEDNERVQEILMLPGKQYRAGNCKLMLEYVAEPAPEYVPSYTDTPAVEELTVAPLPIEEYSEIEIAPQELPTEQVEEVARDAEPVVVAQEEATQPKAEQEHATPIPADKPTEEPVPSPVTTRPAPKRKFVPPPPRKALVQRAAPRPFYTATGKLNTDTETAKPKELKHRKAANGDKVKREPSIAATSMGLPYDFGLSLRLLNTLPTLEEGDLLRFAIKAEKDCYFYLIQYDSDNNAAILVPGVGGALNKLKAHCELQIPPTGNNSCYELYVEPPYGTDTIFIVAGTHNIDWIPVWQENLAQRDNMSTLGEVERNTIAHFKDMEKFADALWSVAMLTIKTGE